jgi:hypothetical protein
MLQTWCHRPPDPAHSRARLSFDGPNTLRFLARRFDESFQDEFVSVQIELLKK